MARDILRRYVPRKISGAHSIRIKTMNQHYLNKLKNLKNNMESLSRENISCQNTYNSLLTQCDHEYPNGASAINEELMFCRVCKICGWSDL